MASSADSSVLYVRDAPGNHAETRTGAYIYNGDAASFHEWEFRARLRIAGNRRSDMLLDLSGSTREERVMVQSSIGKERDLDRVSTYPSPGEPKTSEGQRQRRVQTC